MNFSNNSVRFKRDLKLPLVGRFSNLSADSASSLSSGMAPESACNFNLIKIK
jgi:hypothetical protein